MKKSVIITGAITSAAVLLLAPAISSGEFDITSLNAQVQNHETRLTKMENNGNSIIPDQTPATSSTTAAAPTNPTATVAGPSQPVSAAAPAPTTTAAPDVAPATPSPSPESTPIPAVTNYDGTNANNFHTSN